MRNMHHNISLCKNSSTVKLNIFKWEIYTLQERMKRDRQCKYNVAMRCVRVSIVAVEKHTFWVCVFFSCLSYLAHKLHLFCAVLYHHLWPVWLYHIFPCYLINGEIFRKKNDRTSKVCFDFLYNVWKKIAHSKKSAKMLSEMCAGHHAKYPSFLSDLTKLDFSW